MSHTRSERSGVPGCYRSMSTDSEVPVYGVVGIMIKVRLHRFGFMRIGNDQIDGPEIGVGDSQPSLRR